MRGGGWVPGLFSAKVKPLINAPTSINGVEDTQTPTSINQMKERANEPYAEYVLLTKEIEGVETLTVGRVYKAVLSEDDKKMTLTDIKDKKKSVTINTGILDPTDNSIFSFYVGDFPNDAPKEPAIVPPAPPPRRRLYPKRNQMTSI
tara:strand:+ start:240 stop:680 length:441 start_codon:yes stop_codon:yes gene_type:complete